jgi:hypothetical protein
MKPIIGSDDSQFQFYLLRPNYEKQCATLLHDWWTGKRAVVIRIGCGGRQLAAQHSLI